MSVKLDMPSVRGEMSPRELQSYLYRLARQIEDTFNEASKVKSDAADTDIRYMIPEKAQAAIEQLLTDVNRVLGEIENLSNKIAALEEWANEFEKSIGNSLADINSRFNMLENSQNGG